MGWNDHIDFGLLDDISDMVGYGILDEEVDAVLIAALTAVANEAATPVQQALYEKNIERLMFALDEERSNEELEYKLSKDD